MDDWRAVGVVYEGEPIDIGGINPWQCEWRMLSAEPVELPHPSYPTQRHRMWVYEAKGSGGTVSFAAGELSAGVWGFYVPSETK